MKSTNKVNMVGCSWNHHLEGGGWKWVCSHIAKEYHSEKSNIKMFTAYEYQVRNKIFDPHIGWFHQVISGPERSLSNIVKSDFWKNNKEYLLHAITVSKYQERFLREAGLKSVTTIYHPTPLDVPSWSLEKYSKKKQIYHVGFHCRNIDFYKRLSIVDSQTSFNYLIPKEELIVKMPSSINVVPRVSATDYEKILTSSIVFMNLTDATANNTILECIARGTPVLVNPVGGIREYLGNKYPLFYDTLEEAKNLINDLDDNLLKNTHSYLLKLKNKYSIDLFTNKLGKIVNFM